MRAHIYLISADAYAAARSGDLESLFIDEDGIAADLDKSWHAIHYLVTGDTELRFLTEGVQLDEVSEPFEVHSPQAIAALNERLSATTSAALMKKFDALEFNSLDIYPKGWDASAKPYLEERLERFFAVVRRAAESHNGFLVCLT